MNNEATQELDSNTDLDRIGKLIDAYVDARIDASHHHVNRAIDHALSVARSELQDELARIRNEKNHTDADNIHLRRENDALTKGGIIEVAVRNRSVTDYMVHWEGRALKAEALNKEWEQKAMSWFASPESRAQLEGYRSLTREIDYCHSSLYEFGGHTLDCMDSPHHECTCGFDGVMNHLRDFGKQND